MSKCEYCANTGLCWIQVHVDEHLIYADRYCGWCSVGEKLEEVELNGSAEAKDEQGPTGVLAMVER